MTSRSLLRGPVRVVVEWAEMIKVAHSVFALPFVMVAVFLARRQLPEGRAFFWPLVLIVVCMISARSVAMTFNRIADAAFDARNPRTAGRALPTARLSQTDAWFFLIGCAVVFLSACGVFHLLFGNPWPLVLGLPALAYLCAYSYAKRFTSLSHLWLGTAIGMSPPAAWIALDPATLGWEAIILGAVVALWISGFDIIYACQDISIDRQEGLFSIPAQYGPRPALVLTRFMHGAAVCLLFLLGAVAGLGWLYYSGVVVVAVLLLLENLAVKPDDFSKVNLAFFTVNGIVSLVLAGAAIFDILLGLPALF